MNFAAMVGAVRVDLTVEQDVEYPTYMVQPTKIDPEWRWTDPAGHEHDASLESAHWKVLRVYWCEMCSDEHEESELVCRKCGAPVEPDRVPDLEALRPIRGLMHATVVVQRDGIRSRYHVQPAAIEGIDFAQPLTEEWLATVERDEFLLERDIVEGLPA